MAKVAKLSPIKKNYTQAFKTLESSLAAHGYVRSPGTARTFTPYLEANGRYRTGLDKTASFLKALSPEARRAEEKWIDEATKELKDHFGDDIDLSPKSKIWNAFAVQDRKDAKDKGVRVSPVKATNEDQFFDTSTGSGLLNYCWIRVHPTIAPSMEAYRRGGYSEAQYFLADEEAETKLLYDRKREINKAIVEFEGMPPTKKKQIARLMGLPVGDSTTEESIYNDMDNLLKQTEFVSGEFKGLQTIRVFNDLCQLDEGRVKVKDLVEQAIRHSIYRIGVGGKIVEGNNTISISKEELVSYLLEDEHQMDLLALQKKLDAKKFANVV